MQIFGCSYDNILGLNTCILHEFYWQLTNCYFGIEKDYPLQVLPTKEILLSSLLLRNKCYIWMDSPVFSSTLSVSIFGIKQEAICEKWKRILNLTQALM